MINVSTESWCRYNFPFTSWEVSLLTSIMLKTLQTSQINPYMGKAQPSSLVALFLLRGQSACSRELLALAVGCSAQMSRHGIPLGPEAKGSLHSIWWVGIPDVWLNKTVFSPLSSSCSGCTWELTQIPKIRLGCDGHTADACFQDSVNRLVHRACVQLTGPNPVTSSPIH